MSDTPWVRPPTRSAPLSRALALVAVDLDCLRAKRGVVRSPRLTPDSRNASHDVFLYAPAPAIRSAARASRNVADFARLPRLKHFVMYTVSRICSGRREISRTTTPPQAPPVVSRVAGERFFRP